MITPLKKYKLLFVSTNRQWGGSEVLWLKTTFELSKLNINLSVITFYNHNKLNQIKDSNINHYIYAKSNTNIFYVFCKRLFDPKTVNVIQRISSINPDLVVVSLGGLSAYHPFIKHLQLNNIPYIVVNQLVGEIHWTTIHNDNLDTLRKVYEKAVKSYFVSAHNLKLHEEILAYKSNNSFVIGNPVGDNLELLKFPSDSKISLAFVGRLDVYHKGLDILIKVFSNSKWQNREIELHLYGDGPNKEQVVSMLNNLDVQNCFLHSHQNSIKEIWSKHHAGIFPSRMEGQSLALLECIKCGRVTIATNVGGAAEIIEDGINGFIARYANEEELDAAMERFWNKKDDLQHMGELAHSSYNKYNGDEIIANFAKAILNELHKH